VDYRDSSCLAERGLCLGDAGQICASDADCCDERCLQGVCGCLAEGETCETDQGCCPGFNCDYGVCSGCRQRTGEPCSVNEECCDGLCVGGICRCCQTCRTADGLYSTASFGLCCALGAVCYPDTPDNPGFARCCTPGLDCLGDPAGPPPIEGANAVSRNTCFTDLD
jgi:hypothetical protein